MHFHYQNSVSILFFPLFKVICLLDSLLINGQWKAIKLYIQKMQNSSIQYINTNKNSKNKILDSDSWSLMWREGEEWNLISAFLYLNRPKN